MFNLKANSVTNMHPCIYVYVYTHRKHYISLQLFWKLVLRWKRGKRNADENLNYADN